MISLSCMHWPTSRTESSMILAKINPLAIVPERSFENIISHSLFLKELDALTAQHPV